MFSVGRGIHAGQIDRAADQRDGIRVRVGLPRLAGSPESGLRIGAAAGMPWLRGRLIL